MGKPEPLCAVLFDIDGTLIDTVDLIVQALDYTYRKHLGVALPRAEIRRLIGLPLSVQMRYSGRPHHGQCAPRANGSR
jgi:phosphoglycolate phosphatase-like HAD superfamily hydrolase